MLSPVLGKARFQPLFEKLLAVALAGLNVGEGAHPLSSGETFVLRYLRDRVFASEARVIVFDVGANTGVYTRTVLDAFGSSATVFAFEPATKAFEMLAFGLKHEPNVKPYNLGFGDEEGEVTLFSAGEGSKLGSLYDTSDRLARVGLVMKQRERVTLTTIDAFCERERIGRINFLKLDVEGHELKILEGSRAMLDRGAIDVVQFEFGAANIDSRTFFKDFYEFLITRFAMYRILQDGLFPLTEYKETYEVYKRATNYLAVRRELVTPRESQS
jgi:FkbM family methyltransferase